MDLEGSVSGFGGIPDLHTESAGRSTGGDGGDGDRRAAGRVYRADLREKAEISGAGPVSRPRSLRKKKKNVFFTLPFGRFCVYCKELTFNTHSRGNGYG